VLGLSTLTIALPTALLFLRERPSTLASGRDLVPEVPVSRALRSRLFWTLVIVVFGGTIATSGALVHLVALLSDRGVPADQAALSVSAMGRRGSRGTGRYRLAAGSLRGRPRLRCSAADCGSRNVALSAAESFAVGLIASICLGFGSGGETDSCHT
jgi:hypothetical protein